jgi:hypothetical protein
VKGSYRPRRGRGGEKECWWQHFEVGGDHSQCPLGQVNKGYDFKEFGKRTLTMPPTMLATS